MNLKEVASLLGITAKEVKLLISEGIELPKSKNTIKLKAQEKPNFYIEESDLDEYIQSFDNEEPGRHPPTHVRRKLLVEAGHRCAICREATPIEFHHIIEFSKLKHYDVEHMLALCPTDHTRCTKGEIDTISQREYKKRLSSNIKKQIINDEAPIYFSWDDIREIISSLHKSVFSDREAESQYDFKDIDLSIKNELNGLGEEYFEVMKNHHEPYFSRIELFLSEPINEEIRDAYFEIVDELRSKFAVHRNNFSSFEELLVWFCDTAIDKKLGNLKRRKALNVLVSFMYFTCEIGRKQC